VTAGHAVDGAGQPEPPWQQRNRNQEDAVDEDVPGRRGSSGNDRQHGDAGTGIVVGAIECEGPEMRRRPQEDDQEQDQRLEPDLAGCRRPTDHRRERTGGAADDDVLRCAPLQPHRVYDDVEEDREGEQGRRRDIDRDSKDGDRADGQDKPERACLGARDPAARNRTPDRAGHHGVHVGVVPHIEDTGGAGSRRDCENCDSRRKEGDVARRDHQADNGGEDGQGPSREASSA